MKQIYFCLLVFLSVISQSSFAQSPSLSINISNPKFRPMNIGVTPFGKTNNAQKLAKDFETILNFSGVFKALPNQTFSSLIDNKLYDFAESGQVSQFDYQSWKKLGLETLVLGKLIESSSQSTLHLSAIDLYGMKTITSKSYRNITNDQQNLAIRHFGDLLLSKITNKSGIFNSKIVFVGKRAKNTNKQIFLSHFDGSHMEQITFDNQIHLSPHLSPNGKLITYTAFKKRRPVLYVYNLETRRHTLLSDKFETNSGGTFTPDSRFVVFTAAKGGDSDIYIVPSNGGEIQPFIKGKGDDVDPAFSSDGKWLAYVSGRFGNPHIFRAAIDWLADGRPKVSSEKRLTFAGWYNTGPSWSDKSERIAFAGYDKDINRYDVFIMQYDGSKMERLTLRIANNEDPSWSPNSQLLVFQSNRIGKYDVKGPNQLYVMNQDGSQQRKLNINLYEMSQPEWGPNMPYPFD